MLFDVGCVSVSIALKRGGFDNVTVACCIQP